MDTSASAYPLRLTGELSPQLSRWLWLVKWLLAIPHFIVLFFLWIAFAVVSVVALFAILFTGRYPRGLFEFNVGILRWSWRVGFYSYSALGTDVYPPFTLKDVPDYPARLDVAYPESLSRGLVLVKWWLLAIPHYLVIAVFAGGAWAGPVTVRNNIFYQPSGYAITTNTGVALKTCVIDHNLIYGSAAVIDQPANCTIGANQMNVDPKLANVGSVPYDWHLQAGSPAIDAGVQIAGVGALGALARKYGAEDRPGFDERRPLS